MSAPIETPKRSFEDNINKMQINGDEYTGLINTHESPCVGKTNYRDASKITTAQQAIDFFNYDHCVASEGGKTLVIRKVFDNLLKREVLERSSINDFKALYINIKVEIGTRPNGKPIMSPISYVWMDSPDRITFTGGVVFDPSQKCGRDHLNLWRGFNVKPIRGSWTMLRNHIFANICGGNEAKFEYLIGWCARMMQFPGEQAEVAIVLQSEEEGTGKGFFARVLMYLLGQYALAVSNAKHLTGNFNSHLQDCVLLFADEAFFAGNPAHVGILKSLITEPTLTIEPKYGRVILCRNNLHVIMATNEKWAVPAGLHARRFFVLGVSPNKRGKYKYFDAMQEELNNGGYEAMLYDLLNYNLSNFNVRNVPFTPELDEQKKFSLDIPMQWFDDVLQRGYVFRSKLGLEETFAKWMPIISTELLYASYMEFSKERREHHPMSREMFGRFMIKLGNQPTRFRNSIVGERLTAEFSNSRSPQPVVAQFAHGFKVGDITTARATFERISGVSFNWPDDVPDDDGGGR